MVIRPSDDETLIERIPGENAIRARVAAFLESLDKDARSYNLLQELRAGIFDDFDALRVIQRELREGLPDIYSDDFLNLPEEEQRRIRARVNMLSDLINDLDRLANTAAEFGSGRGEEGDDMAFLSRPS